MNVINNCNAKTPNVLDNFNQCKDYVNLETDALITAAALTYFRMSRLYDKPDSVIPPDILKSSKEKKENMASWSYQKHALKICYFRSDI